MRKNPRVATSLIEQVPCAFAKTHRNGTPGTHYVMVLLDKDQNILHVGSECGHTHGPGVQVLHELGGQADTCYAAVLPFVHTVEALKSHTGKQIGGNPETIKRSYVADRCLEVVWEKAVKKHNQRFLTERLSHFWVTRPHQAMQRVVDRVTASLLGFTPFEEHGRPNLKVDNTFVHNVHYPHVFRVYTRHLLDADSLAAFNEKLGINLKLQQKYTTMELCAPQSIENLSPTERAALTKDGKGVPFAVRGFDEHGNPAHGQWTCSQDVVMRFAKGFHTVLSDIDTDRFKLKSADPNKVHCIFCNGDYDRIQRHTGGAGHLDRVVQVASLVCKATTSTGLKMLNNPKHRAVFLRSL